MRKAAKVSGGYAIKRKARVNHECHDCGCIIKPGEEYYQLHTALPLWLLYQVYLQPMLEGETVESVRKLVRS